jgi:hypothetical protein
MIRGSFGAWANATAGAAIMTAMRIAIRPIRVPWNLNAMSQV